MYASTEAPTSNIPHLHLQGHHMWPWNPQPLGGSWQVLLSHSWSGHSFYSWPQCHQTGMLKAHDIQISTKNHCFLVAKSCLTICTPMDCSLPGSSAHGISQVRILEWVAISFSKASFWHRDPTCVCYIGRQILYLRHQGSLPQRICALKNILNKHSSTNNVKDRISILKNKNKIQSWALLTFWCASFQCFLKKCFHYNHIFFCTLYFLLNFMRALPPLKSIQNIHFS